MAETTLKYRIVGLLSEDTDKLHSISDIAKKLKVAYSHAHTSVQQLTAEGVLAVQKIGNVSVCRLELGCPFALSYLSMIEARKTAEWSRKNPQAAKLYERIEKVKDSVHCVLVKGNKVVLVVPEKISGVDLSMFRNRSVMNHAHLVQNRHYYKGCIILHGAEKFWSMMKQR